MYDTVIVGGGAAGLNAALVLGRVRRRVLLVDAGRQRKCCCGRDDGLILSGSDRSRCGMTGPALCGSAKYPAIARHHHGAAGSVTFQYEVAMCCSGELGRLGRGQATEWLGQARAGEESR